jgi:hypothetical protein
LQQHDAAAMQAYEYMSRAGIDLVLRYIPGAALPIATAAEQYALIELATPREGAGLRASLEEVLAAAMEAGVILDAVIAESGHSAPRSGNCARSIPRRRNWPAPRSRTTSRCRCRKCRS